jgi:hypothetical protein
VQYLAEQLNWVVKSLLVNKLQLTYGVGAVEKIAMAFFEISSSCVSRL